MLDDTFGPEARFVGIPPGMRQNRSPLDGFQFYGLCRIDGASGVLSVGLHNAAGRELFRQELTPER